PRSPVGLHPCTQLLESARGPGMANACLLSRLLGFYQHFRVIFREEGPVGSDKLLEPRRPRVRMRTVTLYHHLCLIGICLLAVAVTVRAGGAGSLLTTQTDGSQTNPCAPSPGSQAKPPAPASGSQAKPPAAQGGYAGTDTCINCHPDQEQS